MAQRNKRYKILGNESFQQIQQYRYTGPAQKFQGETSYKIGDKSYEIAPWNHPATLANKILKWVFHTYFFGCMIVAPMGHGKTSIAQCIAHFIHTKDPRFEIRWAGSHEFRHQELFFSSLPKKPQIVIFDDISSALKELTEKELEANFNSLTRVRWILDPDLGRIPVIVIVIFHYSKNLEKEFRAQMGMTIFAAFGNEEKTNLDSIAPRNSRAWYTLKQYSEIYDKVFDEDKIEIIQSNGKIKTWITDQPFRPCAAITNTKGNVILYSDQSVCELCVKKKLRKIVPAKLVYDLIFKAHGKHGIMALKHAMHQRGFGLAINPREATAFDFISQQVLPQYNFDGDEMITHIYSEAHKKVPTRTYRKRKEENKILEELDSKAIVTTEPVKSSKLETGLEVIDTEESNNEEIEQNEDLQDDEQEG